MDRDEAIRISSVNRELAAQVARLERELEQERQDRKQADIDAIRALGERNDARRELQSEREANEDMRDLLREVYNLAHLPVDEACIHGRALHAISAMIEDKTPPRRNEAVDPP